MTTLIHRKSEPFKPQYPSKPHLWHLIEAAELFKLETFVQGGLWFARVDTFKDPREGTIPKQNLGLLAKAFGSQLPIAEKEYARIRDTAFASCWHMSDEDPSDDAWDSFGGFRDGIALKTTPADAVSALSNTSAIGGPLYIGEITYIDHAVDTVSEANMLEVVYCVQNGYASEREARLLISLQGNGARELFGKRGPKGPLIEIRPSDHVPLGGHKDGRAIVAPINFRALVKEVLIGRRATEETRSKVRAALDSINASDLIAER